MNYLRECHTCGGMFQWGGLPGLPLCANCHIRMVRMYREKMNVEVMKHIEVWPPCYCANCELSRAAADKITPKKIVEDFIAEIEGGVT